MKISIFGLGYVGCVASGCLAKAGHEIIGVDVSQIKVDFINQGKSPILENQLEEILAQQRKKGRISATTNGLDAVKHTSVSFICVGTPSSENGHLNLSALYNVSREIGGGLREKKEFHVVVIRSTVSPGTNEKVADIIKRESGKQPDKDFSVVSNPEFLREGTAVNDFFTPPYTLIGSDNQRAVDILKEVYSGIDAPFIVTDIKVAEMIKYINNTFHALKITFANEVGRICSKLDIDAHKLMKIFCMDTKLNISPKYLDPGFAYGGSCLPKDLRALVTLAHDCYVKCPVIEHIDISNEIQKEMLFKELMSLGKDKIGFLGLSFKAGTDDLRNSPIVDVIERLLGKGFDVKIYDRNVYLARLIGSNKEYIMKKIPYISKFLTDNLNHVITGSDVIVIVNNEPEFQNLGKNHLQNKDIFDLAGIFK